MDKFFRLSLALFCIGWLIKNIVVPLSVGIYSYTPFIELVAKCDMAMNSSWYISQLNNPQLSKSEQVQMLDCHEYDELRKIMLISGLSEDYLSYLGLKALEIHQRSIEDMVKQHRFIER